MASPSDFATFNVSSSAPINIENASLSCRKSSGHDSETAFQRVVGSPDSLETKAPANTGNPTNLTPFPSATTSAAIPLPSSGNASPIPLAAANPHPGPMMEPVKPIKIPPPPIYMTSPYEYSGAPLVPPPVNTHPMPLATSPILTAPKQISAQPLQGASIASPPPNHAYYQNSTIYASSYSSTSSGLTMLSGQPSVISDYMGGFGKWSEENTYHPYIHSASPPAIYHYPSSPQQQQQQQQSFPAGSPNAYLGYYYAPPPSSTSTSTPSFYHQPSHHGSPPPLPIPHPPFARPGPPSPPPPTTGAASPSHPFPPRSSQPQHPPSAHLASTSSLAARGGMDPFQPSLMTHPPHLSTLGSPTSAPAFPQGGGGGPLPPHGHISGAPVPPGTSSTIPSTSPYMVPHPASNRPRGLSTSSSIATAITTSSSSSGHTISAAVRMLDGPISKEESIPTQSHPSMIPPSKSSSAQLQAPPSTTTSSSHYAPSIKSTSSAAKRPSQPSIPGKSGGGSGGGGGGGGPASISGSGSGRGGDYHPANVLSSPSSGDRPPAVLMNPFLSSMDRDLSGTLTSGTTLGTGPPSSAGVSGGGVAATTSTSSTMATTPSANPPPHAMGIHPAIVQLAQKYEHYMITGSSARCLAMLEAFKEVMRDYIPSPNVAISRHLDNHLKPHINYLVVHGKRPLAVSMGNAIRQMKFVIASLPPDIPIEEAREQLYDCIDGLMMHGIVYADRSIVQLGLQKINDGDVILIYSRSSVVVQLLIEAHKKGKQISVVIVDSRPWFEGKKALKELREAGLCSITYLLITSLSYILPRVSKIILGAHCVFSNGTVLSRMGSCLVALQGSEAHVPVLVACETCKFTDKVQLDSVMSNERIQHPSFSIHPPTTTAASSDGPHPDYLNLMYDITPSKYINMIITEIGMIPTTSVPVVLREQRPFASHHMTSY